MYITNAERNAIIAHAKREAPNEACGILAGPPSPQKNFRADKLRRVNKIRKVTKIYRMTNADKSAQTFFMDPKEQFKVMKEIRNLGLKMTGIYHSHPHTDAYPSAHDVELAYYPEALYVIVSIKDKDNPSIRAFEIIEGKIKEEEVNIE